MTREEQIRNEAIDFSEYEDNFLEYDDCGDVCDDKSFIENAFISGAKWADEHPDPNTIKKIFKFALEKTNFLIADNLESIDWEVLIKKAMEE